MHIIGENVLKDFLLMFLSIWIPLILFVEFAPKLASKLASWRISRRRPQQQPHYDPRYEPYSEARYDRGDGNCFHCREPLTETDPGFSPPGEPQQQIHNRCLAELEAEQNRLAEEARVFGAELTASLDRVAASRAKAP